MNKLEELKGLLKWKKSISFYAEKLNITEEEVKELLKELRNPESTHYLHIETGLLDTTTTSTSEGYYQYKVNVEKGTLESEAISDFEPKNDQELAALHKVDLTKYKISSYWTKQRGDKFTSSLLCTLKKPTDFNPLQFVEFLKSYKSPILPTKFIPYKKEGVFVEISLMDFHLDKKTLIGDTLQEKKEQYLKTLQELIYNVRLYSVNSFVFTIGSDFFQTDTFGNTTTKGTPVDTDVSFDKAYEEGFDLLVKAIQLLREEGANVHVIYLCGNHDRTKGYYLAHALDLYFREDKAIYFDREYSPRKYAILGNTFIGYHHGDCKIDDLPLIFATDNKCSALFGAALYREVHTGDKHYYMAKEVKGVRVQQMPSLSATDRWHDESNFINNVRAGLALVYHATKGKIAEFESRI